MDSGPGQNFSSGTMMRPAENAGRTAASPSKRKKMRFMPDWTGRAEECSRWEAIPQNRKRAMPFDIARGFPKGIRSCSILPILHAGHGNRVSAIGICDYWRRTVERHLVRVGCEFVFGIQHFLERDLLARMRGHAAHRSDNAGFHAAFH